MRAISAPTLSITLGMEGSQRNVCIGVGGFQTDHHFRSERTWIPAPRARAFATLMHWL